MSEVGVEIVKTEETEKNKIKYLNINVSNSEVERKPDIVRLCADASILEYVKPKTGHWVEENINEWSRKVFCSECGCTPPFEHVSNGDIYSASGYGVTNKTKFCPNCGCRMVEPQESEEV